MPTEAETLDLTLHALADANRRSIVARLSRGPASVSELAAPLSISLPAVTQHLDVLQKSGIVSSEKNGRVRTCRLEPKPLKTVEEWVALNRRTVEGHLDRIGEVLDRTYGEER